MTSGGALAAAGRGTAAAAAVEYGAGVRAAGTYGPGVGLATGAIAATGGGSAAGSEFWGGPVDSMPALGAVGAAACGDAVAVGFGAVGAATTLVAGA